MPGNIYPMFHSRPISILKISLALISLAMAQSRIGDWKIHSSTLKISGITAIENTIYCATEGGLLTYNTETEIFEVKTVLDGLERTSISTIHSPDGNLVWVGGQSPNGFIQVMDVVSDKTVFTFDQSLTEVTNFHVLDSAAFAVYRKNQEFGLVKFSISDGDIKYRDFFRNWPDGITRINSISTFENTIFVGTNVGLYTANYKTGNLKDPLQWNPADGFSAEGNALVLSDGDNLLAVVGDSLQVRDMKSGTTRSWFLYENLSALDLELDADHNPWILTDKRLYRLEGGTLQYVLGVSGKYPLNLALSGDKPFIGTEYGLGIYNGNDNTFSLTTPNTLSTNDISAVLIKSDGRIVAGSRRGLSILEDWGWRNIVSRINGDPAIHERFISHRFAADTIPIHFGEFIADLEEGPDGRIYCAVRGTYPEPKLPGGGIISIDIDNPLDVILIDTTHLDYFGDQYMVVKDLELDQNGKIWIADAYSTTRNIPIHAINPDGTWEHFQTSVNEDLGLTPNSLAFDSRGRLWIASFRDGPINGSFMDGGLTMMTFSDGDYSFSEIVSHADNTMRTVWSIDVSSDDRLYALTPAGLVLIDLRASDSSPVAYRNPLLYFSNIPFGEGSRVELDPRENAWVLSSSEGIHVLKENTSYWPDYDPEAAVEKFSENNSPLLSNQVTDIDFDPEKGLAVISSSRGVNILKIPFAEQYRNMSSIKVFPSPFFLPSSLPMVVTGLMDKSSVRIMGITGHVFRTIAYTEDSDNGYQVTWDGRDESGKLVGTGIYLIGIFEPGGKVYFEKVAVIRK